MNGPHIEILVLRGERVCLAYTSLLLQSTDMKLIILTALVAVGIGLITAVYGALTFEPRLFEGGLIAIATSAFLAVVAIGLLYLNRYLNSPLRCLHCNRDVKKINSLGEQCHACIKEEKHNLIQLRQSLTVARRKLNEELTAIEQYQENELRDQFKRLQLERDIVGS